MAQAKLRQSLLKSRSMVGLSECQTNSLLETHSIECWTKSVLKQMLDRMFTQVTLDTLLKRIIMFCQIRVFYAIYYKYIIFMFNMYEIEQLKKAERKGVL